MVADHLGGTHEGITDDEIAVLNKSAISVSVFDFSQLAEQVLKLMVLSRQPVKLGKISFTYNVGFWH